MTTPSTNPDDVPDGDIDTVLGWVQSQQNPAAAAEAALTKERDGQNRAGLIEQLDQIAASDDDNPM